MNFKPVHLKLVLILTLILGFLVTTAAASDVTIKGRVVVQPLGTQPAEPVSNVKVEIWDAEIINYPLVGEGHLPWPDEKIRTVYTNPDGEFTVTINNDDGDTILGYEGGRDIYLKIYATNSHFDVRTNVEWIPFSGIYMHETSVHRNVQPSTTEDFGDIQPSGDTQTAFEIIVHLERAHKFVLDETGINLDKTKVFYKDLFTPSTPYCFPQSIGDVRELAYEPIPDWIEWIFTFSPIVITTDMINDLAGIHAAPYGTGTDFYEMIHHEYGHYVMDQIGDFYPPFTVLVHYTTVSYNPEHAFQEGWAHFFSSAVREAYSYPTPYDFGLQHIEDGTLKTDSIEGAIAEILWDFYDDTSETGDNIDLTFNDIVEIIRNYDPNYGGPLATWPTGSDHPWNIEDFFMGYATTHAYDPSVGEAYKMLQDREIDITDAIPPQNPTTYTSSHNSHIYRPGPSILVNTDRGTDSISGVKGYYRLWDHEPDTALTADDIYSFGTSTHIVNPNLEDGIWYLHLLTVDNAGNPATSTFHAGPFLVGEQFSISFSGQILGAYNGIFTQQGTQVTIIPDKLDRLGGKLYTGSKFIFGGGLLTTYSEPFELNMVDGLYDLVIYGVKDEETDLIKTIPLLIDSTPPEISIDISNPIYIVNPTYITRDTSITIEATDEGSGLSSLKYKISSTGYDSGWITYTQPFQLSGLPDDEYTLDVEAVDNLENSETDTKQLTLDNTPPTQTLTIAEPMISGPTTIVTDNTQLTITVDDIGSGVESKQYRITSNTYDSDWTPYLEPFTLPETDGAYTLKYKAIDNLGNPVVEETELENDNTGPTLEIISPEPNSALQNTITLRVTANDPTGVQWVTLTIRETGDPDTNIGFDDIHLTYEPIQQQWRLSLNTLQLDDGNYDFKIKSMDMIGNTNEIKPQYSIQNPTLGELLPSSSTYRAGRTIPIKFQINVNIIIDPQTPFVHNEELVIKIYKGVDLLQTSTYGVTSTDYRIDTGVLYITNFKTLKTPGTYKVEVLSNGALLGAFTFETTRK